MQQNWTPWPAGRLSSSSSTREQRLSHFLFVKKQISTIEKNKKIKRNQIKFTQVLLVAHLLRDLLHLKSHSYSQLPVFHIYYQVVPSSSRYLVLTKLLQIQNEAIGNLLDVHFSLINRNDFFFLSIKIKNIIRDL